MTHFRIGNGFDAHKIKKGNGITLGGIFIPCDYSLIAHSDGDIISHTVCDALLGAANLGDIGVHFPNIRLRQKPSTHYLDLLLTWHCER